MRLSSRIARPGPNPISNTRSSLRTSSRETTHVFLLRFEDRCAISRPAARPNNPVGRPNWARSASIALCLNSIRLTSLSRVLILHVEATSSACSPTLRAESGWRAGAHAVRGLLCMSLDVEPRKPLKPAGQIPVALAEELHRCGHEHTADECRVDQQRNRNSEPHLLQHDEVPCREAGEDGDDDQRGARDDARRRADSE